MSEEVDEPMLPYTASHTGRRARVGYLGLTGIGFNGLWPLFVGLVASLALGLHAFLGAGAGTGHWFGKTLLAAVPALAGFAYLRFLVAGRPPHFKGDLWAAALGLGLDFSDPPIPQFPILPGLSRDPAVNAGPARAGDLRHPRRGAHGVRRSK
jgi:hypothetical protein